MLNHVFVTGQFKNIVLSFSAENAHFGAKNRDENPLGMDLGKLSGKKSKRGN